MADLNDITRRLVQIIRNIVDILEARGGQDHDLYKNIRHLCDQVDRRAVYRE